MKKGFYFTSAWVAVILWVTTASAHFGMVIPSDSMVMQEDNRSVTLQLSFSHPFEMVGMELVKPKAFGVVVNGKKEDLGSALKPIKVMDHSAWQADYAIKRPGRLHVLHGTAALLGAVRGSLHHPLTPKRWSRPSGTMKAGMGRSA